MVVGRFTLRPLQCAAVRAIDAALAREGGALLADPPGTGKTVIALAVARRFDDTLVLAPAALRAQWEASAYKARRPIRFVSLEAVSRAADPRPAALIIVDEAHHLRTPGTRRYSRVARLTIGARVLLLTATPVVNRASDRDALLGLIVGGRVTTLDESALARLIIRRESGRADLPSVRRIPSLSIAPPPPGLRDALNGLPPPFPAADGAAALALIRISLAMAWSSSLAALEASLRRRVQRGEALADALAEGRWPTREALKQWVVADDSTQLVLLPIVASGARPAPATALPILRRHLEAVATLRARISGLGARDAAVRATALRRLCAQRRHERVVVFARHTDTIRALWSALRGFPGTVAVTGDRVMAAAGRWTRAELLAALGPRARPWNPSDSRGIRLVLATDLLSEGVELQGARVLVHGDGAWNPARLEQRVGRLARVGATGADVLVTQFRSPDGARPLLQLARRLHEKERVRSKATAVARRMEAIDERMRRWSARCATPRGSAVVASVRAPREGFLAAVELDGDVQLVAASYVGDRWRVGSSPGALASVVAHAEGGEVRTDPTQLRAARRVLTRWARRQKARGQAGTPLGRDASVWLLARRRVDEALRGASLTERTRVAERLRTALTALERAPGAGLMRALRDLLGEQRSPAGFCDALWSLAAGLGGQNEVPRASTESTPRLLALLLLSAARCAPPAVSPRTAALR